MKVININLGKENKQFLKLKEKNTGKIDTYEIERDNTTVIFNIIENNSNLDESKINEVLSVNIVMDIYTLFNSWYSEDKCASCSVRIIIKDNYYCTKEIENNLTIGDLK